MTQPDFFGALKEVLIREIDNCVDLLRVERLSGGASMETYRLLIETTGGENVICMRRGAGGIDRDSVSAIGLSTEALLMRTARQHDVPEPEVYYVLTEEDNVGVGFIMEWLNGETLGARIVRSPELDDVRGALAEQCGRELAKIHAIDTQSSGLVDHLPVLDPATYLDQTWDRYKEWDTPQPRVTETH